MEDFVISAPTIANTGRVAFTVTVSAQQLLPANANGITVVNNSSTGASILFGAPGMPDFVTGAGFILPFGCIFRFQVSAGSTAFKVIRAGANDGTLFWITE